jgi:apolipoprotein N-acyltransferase
MVRGTPTGISAVVDAYGRTLPGKLLGQGAYGAIDAVLPPALPATLFVRFGDAGLVLLMLGSAAAAFRGRNKV